MKFFSDMQTAVIQENLDAIIALFEQGAKIDESNQQGDTLLHVAVGINHTLITGWLLNQGANIHAKDNLGITALHVAVISNNVEITTLLLDQGANINVMDENGNTPLHLANVPGPRSFQDLDDPQPFRNPNMVRLLLERGADPSARNYDGETPLHNAASSSSEKIIELLLKSGSDINAQDHNLITPLHHVACKDDPDLMQLILTYNPRLNVQDHDKRTPLNLAISSGNQEVIQKLLAQGAYTYRNESAENILRGFLPYGYNRVWRTEENFYTALLLAGVRPYDQALLHEAIQPLYTSIQSTIQSWLSTALSQNEQIDWNKQAFQVLRVLPRLIQFVKGVSSMAKTELYSGYTANDLKTFLFIPDSISEITREDKIKLHNRLTVLQEIVNAGLPVEIVLSIQECLIDRVMVEALTSAYQLNYSIADYLWRDCKKYLDNYIEFHKRIFSHDWRERPCSVPNSSAMTHTLAI